jgi:hypothetical protein
MPTKRLMKKNIPKLKLFYDEILVDFLMIKRPAEQSNLYLITKKHKKKGKENYTLIATNDPYCIKWLVFN